MDLIIEFATDQAPALDRTVYVPPYTHLWRFHHHSVVEPGLQIKLISGSTLRDVRIEMNCTVLHVSETIKSARLGTPETSSFTTNIGSGTLPSPNLDDVSGGNSDEKTPLVRGPT